jgi:hypothetical protein
MNFNDFRTSSSSLTKHGSDAEYTVEYTQIGIFFSGVSAVTLSV